MTYAEEDIVLEQERKIGQGAGDCLTHIFEAIQVLVTLATRVAVEGLFLFHSQSAGIRSTGLGVYN